MKTRYKILMASLIIIGLFVSGVVLAEPIKDNIASLFFKFLMDKVVVVKETINITYENGTEVKWHNYEIIAEYKNRECETQQQCISLKGEGFGCFDGRCQNISNYMGRK